MNKYVYWDKSLEIKKLMDLTVLVIKTDSNNKDMVTKEDLQSYTLNDTAAEIIQLIDGTKTYDEIITILASKYNEDFDSIKTKMKNFSDDMSNLYNININTQECSKKVPVDLINQKIIYPLVSSIELTNNCNIRCIHCYGDYGNKENNVISLNNAKTILNDLKDIGVRVIELTGGEITINPDIKEILLYAINLNFDKITCLTNGIALTDELMDIIIKNKSKITVQIDLHSLDDNYLKWFTKVPNTLNLIKSNIIKLAENNVKMRIVTIVTHNNIDEIENIADWVHNLNIDHYAVSPVISLGRAGNYENDLFLNSDDMRKFAEQLQKINKKHKGLISNIHPDSSMSKNCGSLTSHCVISSNGEIKICTFDNLEYFNSSIGNVLKKNIKDIYDDNAEYITSFSNMPSPKIDSLECKECKNKFFCSSCVIRALIKAKEMNYTCPWYINSVPTIIKEKLLLKINTEKDVASNS